jgi:hypothetical protein
LELPFLLLPSGRYGTELLRYRNPQLLLAFKRATDPFFYFSTRVIGLKNQEYYKVGNFFTLEIYDEDQAALEMK